jgi:DNA-binding IclR family transcriptional regulator
MMRTYCWETADTPTYSLPDFTGNCLHNNALGKIYLSVLHEKELSAGIDQLQLTTKTVYTIINQDTLLKELVNTRHGGYVMNIEKYLPGLVAITAPLINPLSHQGRRRR